jgi:glycerophosphoryl diester phosphodiesterase
MTTAWVVLAHRGLHETAPENTLAALDAARRIGAHGAEFDVRRLRDGTAVLHHDAHIRLARRRVALTNVTWSDYERVTRHATRLTDVAAWAQAHPKFLLNVELKDAALWPGVARLLGRFAPARLVVTTFDATLAGRLLRRRPRYRVGWITQDRPPWPFPSEPPGPDLVVLHRRAVTTRSLAAARAIGSAVWVWGVNRGGDARRLAQAGVATIITDAPRRLLEASGQKT